MLNDGALRAEVNSSLLLIKMLLSLILIHLLKPHKKIGSFGKRIGVEQDRSEAIFPTDKFEMAFARFTHHGGLCKALNLFHFGVVRSILHPERDGK